MNQERINYLKNQYLETGQTSWLHQAIEAEYTYAILEAEILPKPKVAENGDGVELPKLRSDTDPSGA
tara:strand:- start:1797 stop:1997 length:201 start_codon:yes stop_codon:yes gene_type:complete